MKNRALKMLGSIAALNSVVTSNVCRLSLATKPGSHKMLFGGKRSRVAAFVSLLTAGCMLWSFVAAPAALAAHMPVPQVAKPHSVWMLPEVAAHMKAQAQKVRLMQSHAQAHLYPYAQANAQKAKTLASAQAQANTQKSVSPLPNTAARPTLMVSTQLNNAGQMASVLPLSQIKAWSRELTAGHPAPARAAWLHVWLGEWQLAHNQQPETAVKHFQAAQRLCKSSDPIYGLAAYDRAFAFFDEGAYGDAVTAFTHILAVQPRLKGFDHREAAMWLRHAGACAGYHADRAKAGIPEPPRLDPLCGAASLAASLRALGCPADRKVMLASMHVTGEGSSLQDIVAGAQKFGLHTRIVDADDKGLMVLPKPLVAYVEHDHFVSVVRADAKGVSYLCSDCGPWPGGRVDLTWKQWHLLEGGLYVSVALPGSANDKFLAHLDPAVQPDFAIPALSLTSPVTTALTITTTLPNTTAPIRLAFTGSLSDLHLSLRSLSVHPLIAHTTATVDAAVRIPLSELQHHVVLTEATQGAACGAKGSAPGCTNCITCCQTSAGGAGGSGPGGGGPGKGKPMLQGAAGPGVSAGPSAGEPVNLATGEEEYTPKADLEVYNPHGPSVTWSRIYNSLRRPGQGFYEPQEAVGNFEYEMNDFGEGWSRSYNVGVSDQYPGNIGTSYPKSIFFENGARIQFVVPSLPTASVPQVQCQPYQGGQPLAGVPFLIYANYSASGNYYSIVFSDRIQWITTAAYTVGNGIQNDSVVYPLGQLVDRNSNAITFHYGPAAGGNQAGTPYAWPLLSSITNQDGTALLTVVRANDGLNSVAAVYDCYGRSVLYHVSTYLNNSGNDNIPGLPNGTVLYGELDHVSQLVATGTGTAPDRYVYGYQNYGYGWTYLHTISVPNPSGASSLSIATINYDYTNGFVTSIVDGNGNTKTFTSVAVTNSTSGGDGTPGSSTAPTGTLTTAPAMGTNYTEVTVSAGGNDVYSYVAGCDMNMSGAIMTDGQGRITSSKTFADPSNPYRPSSETDGNGKVTQYIWDQFGNLHKEISPRGTVTNYTYAFPGGQVPSVINSVQATNGGFALGEKVKVQEGTKTATQYAYYEPSGLVQSINSPLPGSVGATLPATPTYAYQYNQYGDITSVTSRGNNAASTITINYNYTSDPGDSVHGITAYSQAAKFNQALTVTDGLGHVTHKRYDTQDNKVAEIDALGNETDRQYTIANDLYDVIYPKTQQTGSGHASDYSTFLYPGGPILTDSKYDESGALVRQVALTYGNEGELLSEVGDNQPEYMTYDALYRPATLADGKAQATLYTYNAAGYVATETYPNGDKVQNTLYDTNGNLLTQIDGRGVETDFIYADVATRLSDIQYPATPTLNVHIHYDGYGRVDTKTDSAGSYTTTYDDLDRTSQVVTVYTNVSGHAVSYTYYPDGSYQSMTTPAGTFNYTYDAAGRIATLSNPFNETSSWVYLDNNWLSGQNCGGVLTAAYTHNTRGVITDLTNRKTDSSATLLSEFANIQYDSVGNMLSISATIPTVPSYGGSTSYSYNVKNELKTEQSGTAGGYTGNYDYDAAGNQTTFNGQTNAFNSANQNTAYTYDQAGNPITYKGTGLTFDAENRLTSYGGSTLVNGFRGDSMRAWKQTSAGRTYFLYSGSQLVCEYNSAGTVTATNTFGPAGLISRHTSSGSVFYAFDTHGSVAQRLGGSGSVLSTQTFDAYGNRLSTDGNTDPYAGYRGQSGYYTDWETGTSTSALELLTFRYYDPSTGRFITRDPIGYKGGGNAYEYCSNGPTGKTDPEGLYPVPPIGSALGGCVAATVVVGVGDTDACNADYIKCQKDGDCIAEALSAGAAYIFTGCLTADQPELFPKFEAIEGCAEGILSAVSHYVVEKRCESKKHCSSADDDNPCSIIGGFYDAAIGCLDGLLVGPWLEKLDELGLGKVVNQAVEGVIESFAASIGLRAEGQCEKPLK